MHPDVHLRPAPLLFSNGKLPALHAGLGEWEPYPHPCWKCPLLEGFLDGSGWDHPSRSGHQQGSVGILNQGHVIESRPSVLHRLSGTVGQGSFPPGLRGRKGPGDKERHKLGQHTGGADHTAHLSARAPRAWVSLGTVSMARNHRPISPMHTNLDYLCVKHGI